MAPKRAASVTVPEDQVVLQEQRDDSSTDDQAPDQVMNNRQQRSAHTYSPLCYLKLFYTEIEELQVSNGVYDQIVIALLY